VKHQHAAFEKNGNCLIIPPLYAKWWTKSYGENEKINVLPIYRQEFMIHSNGVFGKCLMTACYNDCALGKSGAIKTGSHDLIFCLGFEILG